ncbi:MAG: hypothetical protein Q8Q88_19580 [Phenylobacterium sp.]|uniref:hypothetical protein n=1 Tax=Phenylobacterium sp. TaxID=1871053 RepID=UPI002733E2D8|nr:hypothetical protein [Phenylobacterium sp.]MDP3749243.1 hypothetical protein [Phenylobacterium sp.]
MDVVFTIISRNYAAQAATLMESLASAEPDVRRVVVATDGPIAVPPGVQVIDAANLVPDFAAMSAYYDALELNTAVKPHAFRALLAEPGVRSGVYLDPDIYVYRPLGAVREALVRAPLALTPHITKPLQGRAYPNDHMILMSGAYNLGFIAARAEPQIDALLDWWAQKCRFDCRVDFTSGLFTDQKWIDLAPGLVSDVALLRSPSLNLAYWNLEGRELARGPSGWVVDGEPLAFFHFSGFDPHRPKVLSKHQDRIKVAPGSPLAALMADYGAALIRHDYSKTASSPYGHRAFPSGRLVTPAMRRRLWRAAASAEDFGGGLTYAASDWLDSADPAAAVAGLPDITRLMDQVWRDAPWASCLEVDTAEGRLAFHKRYTTSGEDPAAVAAAQNLLKAWRAGVRLAADEVMLDIPWRSGSGQTLAWLTSGPTEASPRAVAAVVSGREDLRRRFTGDPEGLLAWLLGPESVDGRFSATLLPTALLERLASQETILLQAARFAGAGASDLKARLFAAYGLARRARWPAALVRPLRAAFDAPAHGFSRYGPFPQAFLSIWESRTDLQRRFHLTNLQSRFGYLRWLTAGGLAEYGVDVSALPGRVRLNPMFILARLTVRRAPRAEPVEGAPQGGCPILAIMETQGDWAPADAVIFEASAGRFRTAKGTPASTPAATDKLFFFTRRGLVAADVVALLARGVRWRTGLGVWDPGAGAATGQARP